MPFQLWVPSFTLHNGVRLAHFEFGPPEPSPPPLVFIHGWTGDHGVFTPQIEWVRKQDA